MMALLSLAIGSFGIGMTEFTIMGLLPEIARSTLPELSATSPDTAIAHAGWLISLYALGVVVGAPTLTALTARFPRKRVLISFAIALTLFNAAIIIAPNFELVGVSRFLAGLPHGAYFGIAALVAADLLGPGKRAQGVAFALTGLTVANVVGVPVGTFVGQQWGWHAAFIIVAVIFALATVLIAVFVPATPGQPERTFLDELRVFRVGQVWVTVAVGAIGFGGFFALYSYISPLVTDVAGADAGLVPVVLVVVGLGMTVGNLVGGRMADRNLGATLLASLGMVALALVLVALTAQWLPTLFLFVFAVGFASSAASPAIQTRLMDVAGDRQSIAGALNHSALNIGNSLGAALGGAVIAAGWGFTAPSWVGVVLASTGVIIAAASLSASRRSARSGGAGAEHAVGVAAG